MMTMQRRVLVELGLVATLCVGIAAVTPTANAQSPSAAKPDGQTAPKADHAPRGASGAAPPPAYDSGSAEEGMNGDRSDRGLAEKAEAPPTKGTDRPALRMKDLGAVDTRITVPPQPRRADRQQNRLLHSPTGLRIVPPHSRGAVNPPGRNSIGAALSSPARPDTPAPSQDRSPGPKNPAIAARASGPGAAGAPGNPALAPLHAHPITLAPAARRSTIGGSSIARRTNTPAAIGGQAKPLVGINGTEIRPKH